MQIECLIKPAKSGNGYYLYIPFLEKYIFLENGAEKKLLQLYVDQLQKKSETK